MGQMASSHYKSNRLSSVLESGLGIRNSLDLNVTRIESSTRFTLEVSSRRIKFHRNWVEKRSKQVYLETHMLLFMIPKSSQPSQSINALKTVRISIKFLQKCATGMKCQ